MSWWGPRGVMRAGEDWESSCRNWKGNSMFFLSHVIWFEFISCATIMDKVADEIALPCNDNAGGSRDYRQTLHSDCWFTFVYSSFRGFQDRSFSLATTAIAHCRLRTCLCVLLLSPQWCSRIFAFASDYTERIPTIKDSHSVASYWMVFGRVFNSVLSWHDRDASVLRWTAALQN